MKTKTYTMQRVNRGVSLMVISAILISTWTAGCNQNPQQTLAFTNVNLIPMTSETVVKNQTVLVRGMVIVAIGASDEVKIPRGSQVIDGQGAYLMPGLEDMHAHTRQTAQPWADPQVWPVHPLSLYLANGVTTIRDLNAMDETGTYPRQSQEDIRAGRRVGPTIYTSGEKLDASPLSDPEGLVRQNQERGYDLLKVYAYLSVDDFEAAMREAKKLGVYTAGHIPYAVGLEGVLSAGMEEIAHIEELDWEFFEFDRSSQRQPDEWFQILIQAVLRELDLSSSNYFVDFKSENQPTLEKIANQLRAAGVTVCTTVDLAEVLWLKQFHPDTFLARPENKFLDPKYLESLRRGKEYHQVECRGIEDICAIKYDLDRWILRGLHEAGVELVLGTDAIGGIGIVPGFSVHDELRILVENGFSPYEALLTGAVNAAKVVERMTGEGDFGTIQIGKRADLILVSGNPLEDITTTKAPLGVMASGNWFTAVQLSELIKISGSTE